MSCQVSGCKIHKGAKLKVFLSVCLCCYIIGVTFRDKETYIHIAMVLGPYISFLIPRYLILVTLFQFQALYVLLISFDTDFGYNDGMKISF